MAIDQSTGDGREYSKDLPLHDTTDSIVRTTASNSSDNKQDEEKNAKEVVEARDEEVTGFKLVIVIASVALACFLMLIDTMVTTTAIPRITDTFKSLPDVGWYASAYQFGSAAPQPLTGRIYTGRIYTYFNTKWSFLTFFAIFEFGSVLCGAATSSNMLIVGRTVAGIGGAGIINGAIMIISSCVPLAKRPSLIGMAVGVGQLGMAVGPLVGGAFTQYSTWRWCFYVNLPVGALAALVIVFVHIPEPTTKPKASYVLKNIHKHLDIVGLFLFAPAILQLLLALQFGGHKFLWKSSQVIGLFCGFAATLGVWFAWNRFKAEDALIPHSRIRRRAVWASGLYQAFFMSAIYGVLYFLPIYFQAINNAKAVLSGLYLLPTILPQLVMAVVAGGVLSKTGFVIPVAIIGTILLSIGSGLFSMLQSTSPKGWWIGFQIIFGVGSGIGVNMGIVAMQAAVSADELPSAMSFIVFAQSLGPTIALVVCNVIFLQSLMTEVPAHAPGVNPKPVVDAGATKFRDVVPPSRLAEVLVAYANSVDHVFYFVAASGAICICIVWGMGWMDLRTVNVNEKEKEETQRSEGVQPA